jgi:cytochrome c peroxidase
MALSSGSGSEPALAVLGGRIFNDPKLSVSGTESCASCHRQAAAFTGNANPQDPSFPVATGAVPNLLGSRNAPTAMYASFSPSFSFEPDEDGQYAPVGGQFWDGRADTLADQAKGPFVNPREMAMPSKQAVVER